MRRIWWEADPRQIEIAVAEIGLLSGKSVRSPAVEDNIGPDGSAVLSLRATRAYRGVAARLNFVADNREDLRFVAKEV